MKIGIVGSEAAKFTAVGRTNAEAEIRRLLDRPEVTAVVSGHCHLGGIDIWAEEIGVALGKEPVIFPPIQHNWRIGYMPRNLKIARACDVCYCITPDRLPADYAGMRFEACYHCTREGRCGTDHVKSGGCWTVWQARKAGKRGEWITVSNGE